MGCGCASTCDAGACHARDVADMRAAVYGDFTAAKSFALRHSLEPAQMGDLLPSFVWPADVKAYKAKIDPHFVATDNAVSKCATLPVAIAGEWHAFYGSWRKFADASVAIFASWEAQLEQAKRFELELADWQDKIAPTCPLTAPGIRPPSSPFPTGLVLLGVGAVVVAGAVGYSFYRTAQHAGARAKQGRDLLERSVDKQLSQRFGAADERPSSKKSTALARR
ncbi:MAG: hypothetical protein JWL95_3246 [Gemmatimonadetes bacterium]|nr:hypothetical protein [Gemmatimonadota bacterium]